MLSCKEVVKTVSSDERPHWRRRFEVRLHLMMCDHCRKYARQLDFLRAGVRKIFGDERVELERQKIEAIEEEVLRKLK